MKPCPTGRFDAIAFTSAEAVASLARRIDADPSLSGLRELAAFCVGATTAQACSAAGFGDVRSADGDAVALADLMAKSAFASKSPIVLYPAQPNRSNDLGALLPGFDVREFTAYVAEPFDPGRKPFLEAVSSCDAVFLYSQRSASHFADLLLMHVEAASCQAFDFDCHFGKDCPRHHGRPVTGGERSRIARCLGGFAG